ncbi:MAG: FaeA/PapI family transcriptional regulator, partial [Candidatus Thermoplasmatota archaeon]
ECRRRGVQGFPTFELNRGHASLRLEGYQSWESFEEALRALDSDLVPKDLRWEKPAILELLRTYGHCATREVAAVFGVTDDDAEILLEDLEAEGAVARRDSGLPGFWGLGKS